MALNTTTKTTNEKVLKTSDQLLKDINHKCNEEYYNMNPD